MRLHDDAIGMSEPALIAFDPRHDAPQSPTNGQLGLAGTDRLPH